MNKVCELINVTKNYDRHIIFNNFNMHVDEGEIVAVTGKSGCGKTTLLNTIGLLDEPNSGIVRLFGQENIKPNSTAAIKILRNKLCYLFQNFALIDNESIDYNLAIPMAYSKKSFTEKKDLMHWAMEKVKLNLSLKQKVYELSGGEQQRLSIARILLRPCELVLADEPTASLDVGNRNEIMDLLTNLNKEGKTIIIVTHDNYISSRCSRQIVLDAELKSNIF